VTRSRRIAPSRTSSRSSPARTSGAASHA
jgi:hypothetical protein